MISPLGTVAAAIVNHPLQVLAAGVALYYAIVVPLRGRAIRRRRHLVVYVGTARSSRVPRASREAA